MIYVVILALLLLLAANRAVSSSFLYPPTLFTTVWLAAVIGLLLSADSLYAVSADALLVFLIGAVTFSIGGLVRLSGAPPSTIARTSPARSHQLRIRRILDSVLLLAVLGLPLYARSVKVASYSDPLFLATQRIQAVEAAESAGRSFSLLNNLVLISMFVAFAMHYENDGSLSRRWRAYVAIALAIVYGALTGTKGNAVILILTLAFMSFMRERRVRWRVLAVVVALGLLVFVGGLFLVNYAYLHLTPSTQSLTFLLSNVHNYWLGGLVAFDALVQHPTSIESVHSLNRFFLETANGLGAHYAVPSIHAAFTNISFWQQSNTYTIYESYFKDHGWFGVVFGMSILGAVLTSLYRWARRGGALAVVLYGTSACGIILSFQAEHFVLGLNVYIKTFVFFYAVYHVVGRLSLANACSQGGRHA